MLCNTKVMTGAPIITVSGQPVGKVASFDLDEATGRLVSLRVKPRGLNLHPELILTWTAIVEMSEQQVIVADGSVTIGETALAQVESAVSSGTLMKEG